jgi:hypothetical protein
MRRNSNASSLPPPCRRFALPPRVRLLPSVAVIILLPLATGCLSPLAKHAVAFSAASNTVIDNSEDAYRAANHLHRDVLVAAAVTDYDKNPTWSPYTDFKPFLTPAQLDARIKVLDGLKAYAATLVELTSGKTPPDLGTAAAGVGTNLMALNQTASTDLSTSIPGIPVMTTAEANGVSTAVVALGKYLIANKVKGSLRTVTQTMNPNITALCVLLNDDITVLRRQADVDYQTLITDQDQLIRHNQIDVFEHREQIGKLIDMAVQQKANDTLLAKLQTALHTLDLTHQALTAAAQGNNPESLKQKIADLSAAGQDLANYYKSLPTS